MKTVIGLYSTVAEANKVKTALQSEGYEAAHINVIDQTSDGNTGGSGEGKKDQPFTEKVKEFFSGLTEHKDEHASYASRIGEGGALLAVTVPDGQAEETADLLTAHGATGIQDDTTGGTEDVAVLEDNKGYAATTAVSGEQVIPVVQEELVVGKRQVDRGGVRVYSHLVETPVSADVSLRNERVVVDRRVVDRVATEADFNIDPNVIEVSASGEEAVVGRSSRVVEEVRVGKQASEHSEQITDSVRHTEVDVQPTTTTETGKL